MALSSQLNDLKQLLERLQHDMRKREEDLNAKDAEIEEKQCLATSYFNALEVRFPSFILFHEHVRVTLKESKLLN